MSSCATLYIVSTPIGNLADMTLRAIDVLKEVELIAAEDTRHSRLLLEHYRIDTPMTSLHGDNEKNKSNKILHALKAGKSVALISDAGTPLISDPGEFLVAAVREAGFNVVPIPGVCALITALSVSGLSTKRFHFEGFLPHKEKARRDILEGLLHDSATLIFYESRHDILAFLKLAIAVFGEERQAVIARELTKQFETIHAASLAAINDWILADPNQQKGEYVVLIAGEETPQSLHEANEQKILKVLCQHLPTKQAAKLTAEITGGSQRDYYQQALTLKEKEL